jgi:drug/metabolite transporter (DMT)-like permease
MPLSALALVLTAAVLHALWNFAAKKAGGDSRFQFISSALVTLLWAPAAAWAALGDDVAWTPLAWACVLISAVLHLLYFNVLLRGYRVSDLTVVYPVARGSAPLLSVLGAALWLHEPLTPQGAIGALLVCGGVFIIAGGPALWGQAHDPAQRERVLAGICAGARSPAPSSPATP